MKRITLVILLLISCQAFSQNKIYDSISIFYKIDKYKLTEYHKTKINIFLKNLDTTNIYKVKIVSSADYLGTDNYNFILAENRAKEIKKILLSKYPNLFTTIKTINKGEISEKEKEQIDKLNGNVKNRKTSILFLKSSQTKYNQSKKKKVYIYNPTKKEFELAVGKKFVLEKLIFHRGTSIIQQRSQRSLRNLLRFLKENPKVEVEIRGHLCCNAGFYQPDKSKVIPLESTNLSTKRARLVYKYLVKNGIKSKRLTYHGYGFQTPLYYPEITQKNKSLNKRVEIVITKF
jgi:outer membrane protein OmpA-like peptidoglycan-associated protein